MISYRNVLPSSPTFSYYITVRPIILVQDTRGVLIPLGDVAKSASHCHREDEEMCTFYCVNE